MKFFKMDFWRGEDETGVKDLHIDFRIHDGPWYYNRSHDSFVDGRSTMKIRFSFDDPVLLDSCPFEAKIGLNLDESFEGKYIGFAYGKNKDQEALVAWAQRFNSAELIVGLDLEAVSTPKSKVTRLK
jgi:hypothetical protein